LRDPDNEKHLDAIRDWPAALCDGISLAKAKGEVVKSFKVKLSPLKSKGVQDTSLPATAQAYADGFSHQCPGIADFFVRERENLRKRYRKDRFVTSPPGRMRRLPTGANKAVERQCSVTLPQMMEADILKTAAVRLDRIFRRGDRGARMVMTVHDSMWVEVPAEEQSDVRELMQSVMTGANDLAAPLKVNSE
jgi:DNA polymerase I